MERWANLNFLGKVVNAGKLVTASGHFIILSPSIAGA